MMASMITERLKESRHRLTLVQQELAALAERQQTLVQEALQLQGAIAALEAVSEPQTLVTAMPASIPPGK